MNKQVKPIPLSIYPESFEKIHKISDYEDRPIVRIVKRLIDVEYEKMKKERKESS